MASNLRLRPLRLFADRMEDDDEGMEAGARLGTPPPKWDGGEPDGIEDGPRDAGGGGQRLMRGTFVALALAGFFGVLWYAYQWGLGDSELVELPVVAAEAGPDKVKPANPGGLQVPYQDQLVLNQDSATGEPVRVERLLPPPEVPLPPPEPESAAPVEEAAVATPAEVPAETASEEGAAVAIETAAGPPEPETAAEGGETAPSTEVSAAPAPAEPAPAATAADDQATQAATPTATTQVAAVPGSFALQLASLKSSDAAEREWARLRGAHPKLLGGLSLILQPADIQGVGKVYRLQVGTFPSRTAAADLCTQLKTKQQECFVVRR
jgi:cell division septation protein DedD